MTGQKKRVQNLMEKAAAEIRASEPAPDVVEKAASRVWERLTRNDAALASEAAAITEIRGCEDYQALIPAFLSGDLPEARRLLVQEHVRECVPCRRVLNAARGGASADAGGDPALRRGSGARVWLRYAAAAAVIGMLGMSAYWLWTVGLGPGAGATLQTADSQLFRVTNVAQVPILEGERIREGDVVRTGAGDGVVLRLEDGSLVEMRERSELSIREGGRGITVDLERGSVIVQAAPQRQRHLYVSTEDCLVSVTGTIFAVNHGTKGSRVSVIEGEVQVEHGGEELVLGPGDQTATKASLGPVPVDEEIAWSRDVDRYIALLQEITALRRDLSAAIGRPGMRYDSRLLELVPGEPVFYAAFPNLGETLGEVERVLEERIANSTLLSQWWNDRHAGGDFKGLIGTVTGKMQQFGSYLGSEVVVVGYLDETQGMDMPLVMAEVIDPAGLRDFALGELAAHGADMGENVLLVLDPDEVVAGDHDVYLWISETIAVASPALDLLRAVAGIVEGAGAGAFGGTDFYHSIADSYGHGVNILIAADLHRVLTSREVGEGDQVTLQQSGFLDAEHLLVEQRNEGGQTRHEGVLAFSGPRRGVAAWLAAPAPMGSLRFFSPDAKMVAAFVLEDPATMVEDLKAMAAAAGDEAGLMLGGMGSDGFDVLALVDLIAGAMGGELAFAVDGPVLPKPSWKVVLEVFDPSAVDWAFEQLLASYNQQAIASGDTPRKIESEEVGGRQFFALTGGIPEIHYTFVEGYMVMAPSRALLDRAIRYRQSGHSIVNSARFTSLLPVDNRDNFSAVVYQDAMALLEPIAERLAAGVELSDAQKEALSAIQAENSPTLGYAYGEPERIVFAANGTMNLFGLGLLGFSDGLDLGQFLEGMVPGEEREAAAEETSI